MKRIAFVALLLLYACLGLAKEKRHSILIGDSPSIGPANAAVTIIEFIDFQ